ncbi:hypothetical protein M1D70_09320 [Paenibacillus sp. AK002]
MKNKEENPNKTPKGYINKLHFIYIIICLVIVILAILAYTIWDNEAAGVGLNNAATASSIVLAVVAIVMTIVDIAGQRKTVSDLRDTAETLEENLIQTNKSLETVATLENQLTETMESILKSQQELQHGISKIQHSFGSGEAIDKEKLVDQLELLKNKAVIIPSHVRVVNRQNDINEYKNRFEIRDRILLVLKTRKEFSITELLESPAVSSLGIKRSALKNELTRLVEQGIVQNNNGRYGLKKRT